MFPVLANQCQENKSKGSNENAILEINYTQDKSGDSLTPPPEHPSSKCESDGDPVQQLSKCSRCQNQSGSTTSGKVQTALHSSEMLSTNAMVKYVIILPFTVSMLSVGDDVMLNIYQMITFGS